MKRIKASLDERLAAKGLHKIESDLFIKDVRRIINDSPWMNLKNINGQLRLLGWQDGCGDYTTIQLIQACYDPKTLIG